MNRVLILIIVFIIPSVTYSQIDTCFTKEEIVTLSQKIKKLQANDSLKTDLIEVYESQILKYESLHAIDTLQINLMDAKIKLLEDNNKLLQQRAQLIQPKWYENKYLYFIGGVVSATLIIGVAS